MKTASKDFNKWNNLKQSIEKFSKTKIIKDRDIIFLSMGENIGFEQNGKGDEFLRPVIVCKKFSQNTFLGIPLTKSNKSGKFYFPFLFKNTESKAILSQIRLFDTKRIKYSYGRLGRETFKQLKNKLIELLQ